MTRDLVFSALAAIALHAGVLLAIASTDASVASVERPGKTIELVLASPPSPAPPAPPAPRPPAETRPPVEPGAPLARAETRPFELSPMPAASRDDLPAFASSSGAAMSSLVMNATRVDDATPGREPRPTAHPTLPTPTPSPPLAVPAETAPASSTSPSTVTRRAAPRPGNPRPVYPRVSRRLGEQGTVLLWVEVRADGAPGAIEVRRSCGHRRLDQAAVAAVRRWRFDPAMRQQRAEPSWIEIPVAFVLD